MFSNLMRIAKPSVSIAAGALVCRQFSGGAAVCEENQMPMRMLGNTGLQVSVLSYGFWATFGAKDDLQKQDGIDMAKKCLTTARDNGVNLFDNAEVYGTPYGEAERIMGEALTQLQKEDPIKWRRSDILITTKLFWGGQGVNEKGLSRKHIKEGMTNSLKNLQVDYVDLVFCHRPDPYTPTETVVRGMTDLIRSGKATAWGTSEWSAQQITEAVWIAKAYGLEPPQFEQPQYHMFHRERFEQEYHPLYKAPYNLGTTIWSPLASGLLTGKYNDKIPDGSRLTTQGYGWLADKLKEWQADGKIDKVRTLTNYATTEFQCSVAQLSLAWCIKNPNVSTVLLGATKSLQLEENFGALRVARLLTDKHMGEIEAILDSKPAKYQGYGGAGMRPLDTI
jgi:voltage-dependent potassium channel beta subunit